VIGARPNNLPIPGWKTFDFMRIDDEYNCMFPMGLVEPATDTFIEMFIKRNQAIDIANNQAYDMYVGDVAATADLPDKIVRKGGRIIRVNLAATGAANVKSVFDTIQRSANPMDTFGQSEVCKGETQQTMRRNDYVQAGDPSRKETATAVESMEGGAFRDMLQLMDYMNETGLSPVGEKYLLYWDFFNGHQSFDVADTENRIRTIEPGDMREPFKVSVDIAAALDRPHVVRRVVESMQMLREDESLDRYWLNKTFLWFLKYPNADRINPMPEVKVAAIERENIALKNGIMQPVHPGDDHEMHIKIHMERAEADAKTGGFELSEAGREAYAQHLEAHQEFLEQQSGGSPNMTKLKDGPNNGQMIGGNSPKIKGTSP